MATSGTDSESDSSPVSHLKAAETTEIKCYMHVENVVERDVKRFTAHSWSCFLRYTEMWKNYTGPQAEIAREFQHRRRLQGQTRRLDDLPIPPNGGHHRSCYSRYTDKSKVMRAATAKQKQQSETLDPGASTSQEMAQPPPKTRRLRSYSAKPVAGRSTHVLPVQCILCRKEKSIMCKTTRKRRREPLVNCSTIQGKRLLQAAEDNNNEEILMHLRGRDCVALEVRYHHSCYVDYTRYLSTTPLKSIGTVADAHYTKSYQQFCLTVRNRIITNKEIFRLNKLTNMFIDTVKKTEGVDIHNYKSTNLKTRLLKSFPQLCFLQPHLRSQGEIVYVNDVSTETLVQEKKNLQEAVHPSSTSDSSTDDTEEFHVPHSSEKHATLREMFVAAQFLKDKIDAVPQRNLPWPPSSDHLTLESAERLIPADLYNFLAWIVGGSAKPHEGDFVHVKSTDLHRKILNTAQDIIYIASQGKKQMPKHVSLAMTLRHLTGSAQLIGLMNGFGYCSSHSLVLQHDTALAQQEMNKGEDALPSCINKGQFSTLVWDNNDFREDTRSGKGTTHNTNGIIIQRPEGIDTAFPLHSTPSISTLSSTEATTPSTTVPSLSTTPSRSTPSTSKKTKQRSLQPPPANIASYHVGKKTGPKPFASDVNLQLAHYLPAVKYPQSLDLAYNLTKFDCDTDLPSWTGFNQLISQTEVPPLSQIGYLPIIDASPTEMDTVFTILLRSAHIADQLNLDTIVIVMDQAIYSKAQIIRWGNATFMQRLVIRLGAFHTAMSYLGCIGKRFRDAGLQDILIESEVIASGSINGAMTGHHYNRSVRVHKLMYEALQHLKIEAFMQSLLDGERENTEKVMTGLQDGCRGLDFHDVVSSEEFAKVQASLHQYVSSSAATSQTFAFWNSYIEMVEVLLLFLRSIREGNWELHLSSVRSMLPWIYAYDHVNYARYLPAYLLEMSDLANTHPQVYREFRKGNFTVQRSANTFAQIACDQTIEQTVNRDSKTKGGMVGFTTSVGAVNRWIWSHHQRAAITRQCEAMAGKSNQSDQHSSLQPSQMKQDKNAVKNIIDAISDMINPLNSDHEDLVHITSGVVATDNVAQDLKLAHDKGDAEFVKFCKMRLQKETDKSFFDAIPKLRLKNFTTMAKKVRSKVGGKDVVLKSDRNLLARIVIISKVRKIDLQELFTYNLGPLPMSLATAQGLLVKTNKAKLMQAIENHCEKPPAGIPQRATHIIDGMAFIQQLNTKKLPGEKTFANLAHVIMSRIVRIAKSNCSDSVHFVTDRYPDLSIKNAERKKRAVHGSQVVKVYGQSLPQQWKKFLASSQNKENLVEYLFQKWNSYKGFELNGVKVYYAHGAHCHMFSSQGSPDEVVDVQAISGLECNHEEADTRLFLHSAYAAGACSDVVICSPDTDVFIIGLSIHSQIDAHLYFQTGVGDKRRTLDLEALSHGLGECVSGALIGLHCLTGCDSVSAFYGKGKTKAFKLILENNDLCTPLQQLGEEFDVQPELMKSLELFVCRLYGQKNCNRVNAARYDMFRLTCKSELVMPPNQDSLEKHILRANYQATIFKQSLLQTQELPSPVHHGWKMEEGELAIEWSSLPAAPESVLTLVHCTGSCKKRKCLDLSKCSCLANNLPCTDLCACRTETCSNTATYIDDEDENTDSDSKDE